MTLTNEQLAYVMPRCPPSRRMAMLEPLTRAMAEFDIDTPARVAAFLAQIAHESRELRSFEELATGRDYEGRSSLGNTEPGDGRRFKGRGPIQLTGRANYRAAGRALGLPLEDHPEFAAHINIGFRVAAWFWTSRRLNELADVGDFDGITKRINGGLKGKLSRDDYHERALKALSA